MSFTFEQIQTELNKAVDDIDARADLPETGARDALNLLVNVVVHRLSGNAAASIDDVIRSNYDSAPDAVVSWLS